MQPSTLTHNIDFIAKYKPLPLSAHTLKMDMHSLPQEDVTYICQALSELGIRFYQQRDTTHAMLCFDKEAFELLQEHRVTLEMREENAPRKKVALH
jgi:hypothetical protein